MKNFLPNTTFKAHLSLDECAARLAALNNTYGLSVHLWQDASTVHFDMQRQLMGIRGSLQAKDAEITEVSLYSPITCFTIIYLLTLVFLGISILCYLAILLTTDAKFISGALLITSLLAAPRLWALYKARIEALFEEVGVALRKKKPLNLS